MGTIYERLGGTCQFEKTQQRVRAFDGILFQELSDLERQEVIGDFRRQLVPLIVLVTLMRHSVRKYHVEYLESQIYLHPSPKQLMLRNHV